MVAMQGRGTGDGYSSIQQASALVPDTWFADGWRMVLLCGGVVLLDCTGSGVSTCGTVALCRLHSDAGGELIGRVIL